MNSAHKGKRRRVKPTHRWTESETKDLMAGVLAEIKLNPEAFEKPTAQTFYTRISSRSERIKTLGWVILKSKMRHLKTGYVAAWKQQRETEQITDGAMKMDMECVEKMCPHWHILNQIFCQQALLYVKPKTEPPEINGSTYTMSCDGEEAEEEEEEQHSEGANNDSALESSQTEFPNMPEPSTPSEMNFSTFKHQFKTADGRRSTARSSGSIAVLLSMQEKKLHFEQMKLDKQLELEKEKIGLEKEKIGLEKTRQQIEMKKIELQHELELRKLEIDRDERVSLAKMKLEIETAERIKKYKMELDNINV